ncbi:hypothetical protein K438DRAFT_2013805 [Mycena galopus ATCC 62051]|nr:hypothetical protein K438DRAFT_2013805 [Mycena galopus ATCC 62051]
MGRKETIYYAASFFQTLDLGPFRGPALSNAFETERNGGSSKAKSLKSVYCAPEHNSFHQSAASVTVPADLEASNVDAVLEEHPISILTNGKKHPCIRSSWRPPLHRSEIYPDFRSNYQHPLTKYGHIVHVPYLGKSVYLPNDPNYAGVYDSEAIATQIVDDVIAMGLNVNGLHVVLLNWRTGRTMTECSDLVSIETLNSYHLAHTSSSTTATTCTLWGGLRPTHSMPPFLPPTPLLSFPVLLLDQHVSSVRTQLRPFCSNPTPGMPFSKSNENCIYMLSIIVQVLDFRVNAGRADMLVDPAPAAGFHIALHLEPTVFPVEGVLQNAVTTILPYCFMWCLLEEESDWFLPVDQDRLFGISILAFR